MPKTVLWHFFNNSCLSWTAANSEFSFPVLCFLFLLLFIFWCFVAGFCFFCSAGSAIDWYNIYFKTKVNKKIWQLTGALQIPVKKFKVLLRKFDRDCQPSNIFSVHSAGCLCNLCLLIRFMFFCVFRYCKTCSITSYLFCNFMQWIRVFHVLI